MDVNGTNKTVTRLSVHEFLEQMLPAGDLFAAGVSFGQLQEGTRAHQRVQEQAGPETQAEVPVLYRAQSERSVLEIGGRMDGWRVDETGPTVLEIKSTRQDPGSLGDGVEAHWNQARIYGAIQCLRGGYPRMGVELVYVGLPGGQTRTLRREYDAAALTGWFLALCEAWLRGEDAWLLWQEERNTALARFGFPFERFRSGQRDMAARIYRTARDGGACLVQAPTGIGKTMAALFPALKALGEGHIDRIFYLTARTTVKSVAGEALERIIGAGLPLRAVTLTAKEKCCPEPDTACHPAYCARAAGFFDRLAGALSETQAAGHWGRQEIDALAQRHGLCPFELSLAIAQRCDVVVCDYNYAFDPRVYLRRFFEEPGQGMLLVDEAHNLVDRARDMFSAELTRASVLALTRTLRGKQPDPPVQALKKATGTLNRALLALCRKAAQQPGSVIAHDEPPRDLIEAAQSFCEAAEPLMDAGAREPYAEALIALYFECRAYIRAAETFDSCCAPYTRGSGSRALTRIYCLDPASRLTECFERARAAALYSATLTPFSYYTRLLGLHGANTLALPSPFPQENLLVLLDGQTSTAYRHRDETLERVARALWHLASARPGHYIAYFPSYRYMEQVRALCMALYPGLPTLAQRPDMTEAEREEFLRRFDEDGRTLLGFAVMGGFFGEGVDLTGERLIGAAIVGVGLPQLCAERELIRRYHDEQGEDGYGYAYRLPGFLRVMQAAGRVIRSAEDRGVVLLIDPRFDDWRLRELMPEWWEPVVRADDPGSLSESLLDFWRDGAPDCP